MCDRESVLDLWVRENFGLCVYVCEGVSECERDADYKVKITIELTLPGFEVYEPLFLQT